MVNRIKKKEIFFLNIFKNDQEIGRIYYFEEEELRWGLEHIRIYVCVCVCVDLDWFWINIKFLRDN